MSKENSRSEAISKVCLIKAKDFEILKSTEGVEYLEIYESMIDVKGAKALQNFIAKADKLKNVKIEGCTFGQKSAKLIDQIFKDYIDNPSANLKVEVSQCTLLIDIAMNLVGEEGTVEEL